MWLCGLHYPSVQLGGSGHDRDACSRYRRRSSAQEQTQSPHGTCGTAETHATDTNYQHRNALVVSLLSASTVCRHCDFLPHVAMLEIEELMPIFQQNRALVGKALQCYKEAESRGFHAGRNLCTVWQGYRTLSINCASIFERCRKCRWEVAWIANRQIAEAKSIWAYTGRTILRPNHVLPPDWRSSTEESFVSGIGNGESSEEQETSNDFMDTRFILCTANICALLFSKERYSLSDYRKTISRTSFEAQMFFHVNPSVWPLSDVSSII